MSGVEAGAEFGLTNSSSTHSMSVSSATIPQSHQLNSTSPFVDSGVDLNVMSQFSGYHSVDNEDDVFIVDKNGTVHDILLHFS